MQAPDVEDESEVIRVTNLLRVVIYFLAVWIQIPIYLACISESTTSLCDMGLVLVPVVLAILDSFLVLWSTRPSSGFRIAAALLSIAAIAIAIGTVVPFFLNVDYIIPMAILGFGIIGVSLVELAKLIGAFRNQTTTLAFEAQPENGTRTY